MPADLSERADAGSRGPRLFLSGYFGFANIGDEALLQSALRGFRAISPGVAFQVLCGNADAIAKEPDCRAVDWRDPAAIMDALSGCDAVVFAGGLLHDSGGAVTDRILLPATGGLALHAGIAIFASLVGCKSIHLAIGAGPLQSVAAQELVRRVCERAAWVSVRDEGSKTLLGDAGLDPGRVHVGSDLVFAYPPEPEIVQQLQTRFESGARKPRIGLALRFWKHDVDPDFWERQVAEAVAQWAESSGGEAVFLPMQTGEGAEDDRSVAGRIVASMALGDRVLSVTEPLSPGQMRWALSQCDLVIGMRYHAIAFAALNATPFLSISYDPKVRALVGQLGLGHLDTPVGSVTAAGMAKAIDSALAQADGIRPQLILESARLRTLALAVFGSAKNAIAAPSIAAPSIAATSIAYDPLIAQTLRAQAGRIRELDPLGEWAQLREVALAHAQADLSREQAHSARIAEQRDRIEKDFRVLHGWSEAQGEHIKVLIADVEEAQRAATARRFPLPNRDQLRRAVHFGLDLLQKLTPESVRRAIRPFYLALYRSAFPAGKREFQQIAPARIAPAKKSVSAIIPAPAPPSSDWPIGVFPLVSVVLPVWNQPHLLGAGIRSILNQTYRNLELIVVDDGSTADLAPVAAEFQSDPRFRCVRRPHEGLPRTLSAGFRMARGDFWTWTSADNLAHPRMLEALLAFLLRRPDVDMTFGNMDLIDDRGAALLHSDYRVHSQRAGASNELDLPHSVETLASVNDNFIGACFLYRADIGCALGDYDDSLLGTEDYDYWLRMQSAGKIAHVDTGECLYAYRVHDDSLSGRHAPRIGQNAEKLIEINRERSKKWRGPFQMSAPPIAAVLIPEWEKRGHSVSLSESLEPDSVLVECQSRTVKLRGLAFGSQTSIPASAMILARKARDNRYPLWDVPSFHHPLLVCAGPIHGDLDWAFLGQIAEALPDATLLFFSTDESRQQDARAALSAYSNTIYLGYKRPGEWISYLSQATVLLAPFTSSSAADISGAMELYLNAGKPVLATEAVAKAGFSLAPHVRFGPESLPSALTTQVDLELNDRYLATISNAGRATQVLKLARARFEAPELTATERSGPSILLETRSFHRGGLERVVLDMAHSLRLERYPVSVAVVGEYGDMAEECSARGVPAVDLQGEPDRLAALLDREKPDLLIPHYSTLGSELAWRRGIPVLNVIHNSYIWAGTELEAEIRQADLFVTRYIAVSSTAKDFFSRRFGANPAKIRVVPNGIDVERCERALDIPPTVTRAALGLAPDDVVLLMVGSLIGTKAQLHAVAALSRLTQRRRELRLILIGPPYDAAYAALLHRTIAEFQLEECVRILPETDAIFDYYRLADALLCTSLTEGWSLAMTEAMFCGLPVLTSNVGGAREAIEDHGLGIVFATAYDDVLDLDDSNLWAYAAQTAPRNLAAIVDAIDAFYEDRKTWRAQAAKGAEIVRSRYSKAAIARRYEQEIESLLREHYGNVRWQDVRWRST